MPITSEDLQDGVNKGGGNKAPGRDSIGIGVFKATWGALKGDLLGIFTQMFRERNISEQQKLGVIMCIPKTARPTHTTFDQ